MATTIPIPLTTLGVGQHDFGPVTAADALASALLSVDRTPANGFNAQTPATKAEIQVMQSNDGGASFFLVVGGTIEGGAIGLPGNFPLTSTVGANLFPGTGRQVKATVIVSGAPVAVSGSLTLT